nr:putative reverse transcriptase domain-containing protein [Tanacetum cinerariifolium]
MTKEGESWECRGSQWECRGSQWGVGGAPDFSMIIICTLSREVAVSMSWNDFTFMMIHEFCPSHEMQKLETELWNHAMVEAGHAAYTDRFHELASFDVIIGMDWYHKAEIICHEKVVRIPLPDGKVLRVLGERPKEKVRLLVSAKASDKKQEAIVVVGDFLETFLDDLSGLPPTREIEFQIELIHGATPVGKVPYRLAPSESEE